MGSLTRIVGGPLFAARAPARATVLRVRPLARASRAIAAPALAERRPPGRLPEVRPPTVVRHTLPPLAVAPPARLAEVEAPIRPREVPWVAAEAKRSGPQPAAVVPASAAPGAPVPTTPPPGRRPAPPTMAAPPRRRPPPAQRVVPLTPLAATATAASSKRPDQPLALQAAAPAGLPGVVRRVERTTITRELVPSGRPPPGPARASDPAPPPRAELVAPRPEPPRRQSPALVVREFSARRQAEPARVVPPPIARTAERPPANPQSAVRRPGQVTPAAALRPRPLSPPAPAPPGRAVSIEIGRVEIRTGPARTSAPVARLSTPPRPHAIDPGLRFAGSRGWRA
jgi:hypothetical protein